jgi:transposase
MSRPATLFVPTLKKYQRARIKRALAKARHPTYRDRLRAVLWSEQRYSISQIAGLLGKHPTTVLLWIKDYLRFGISGLAVGQIPGRPPLIDAEGKAVLERSLAKNPHDLGYVFTRWTLPTLCEHLYREAHVRVCMDTVRRHLHRMGYRYNRPKLSLTHRQNRREVARARRQRDWILKKSA